MMWGTHAGLPMIIGMTYEYVKMRRSGSVVFSKIDYCVIGLSGILPDVVQPHIYVEDRHESWSHTVWFFVGSSLLAWMMLKILKRPNIRPMALLCSTGVGLHILCDMISGGVVPFYPYPPLIGKYYVPPDYWIPLDLFVVFILLIVYVELRRLKKSYIRNFSVDVNQP